MNSVIQPESEFVQSLTGIRLAIQVVRYASAGKTVSGDCHTIIGVALGRTQWSRRVGEIVTDDIGPSSADQKCNRDKGDRTCAYTQVHTPPHTGMCPMALFQF